MPKLKVDNYHTILRCALLLYIAVVRVKQIAIANYSVCHLL